MHLVCTTHRLHDMVREGVMTQLHTNEEFLTALRDASTENSDRQQRVSFIMGSLPDENSMTREQVESFLDRSAVPAY